VNNTTRLIRQTLTIARRDFIATVFTPAFLLFLLAPLIMMSFGSLGGVGAASMATAGADKVRIVAIANASDAPRLASADLRLRRAFRSEDDEPPLLRIDAPSGEVGAQARKLIDGKDIDVSAVLYGPLDKPMILYSGRGASADYLALLAEEGVRSSRVGDVSLSQATKTKIKRTAPPQSGHGSLAYLTVFALFLMTLLTASQVIGTMAEERNNKVIEVLAAAVPLESVFLGKLLGMFGVAIVFVAFWGMVAINITAVLPAGFAAGLSNLTPAVGQPMFGILFCVYFSMSYLLLGTAFLIVGAQASTPREIQMMSLPLTFLQMAMLGLSLGAASNPDSWLAFAAEVFPISSPFAMAARAANRPELWPHLLAILWQLLWVSILISLGARWFRRGVLKSGSPRRTKRRALAASN
jgi:ABC-2 type transport system permease protein